MSATSTLIQQPAPELRGGCSPIAGGEASAASVQIGGGEYQRAVTDERQPLAGSGSRVVLWERPLYAAQRTFASLLTSQHFEQILPTRGNHRLQSPGLLVSTARAVRSVVRSCQARALARAMPVPKCKPGAHNLAATRRIPPAGRRQRLDALSAKGCVNPLRKARRCRRGFIGDRVAGSVPAPDPESLRNRGQKARSTRGTRRRSSNPSGTAASRGSPPV